jgi:hypothetical protein
MELKINTARAWACETFRETFHELYGRSAVSERVFSDAWSSRLAASSEFSDGGWYDPPPRGLAVLFGTGDDPRRVNFGSLRDPSNYASDIPLDWSDGLLYAYCSPVALRSGMAGDFAITLYLGSRPEIRAHFSNCYAATREVISCLQPTASSVSTFRLAEDIFASRQLFNAVESVTDVAVLDLGHSIPTITLNATATGERHLSADVRAEYSRARRFINDHDAWPLSSVAQITIEPQLRSRISASLPQVSFHYIVAMQPAVTVLDYCDDLLRSLALI